MRISYVVPRCVADNSHGRYVIELATRLGREHSVTVYSGAFWPPLNSLVSCRLLPVPNRPAVVRLALLWASSRIRIDTGDFEIIHVQGADAPIGNVVTTASCNVVARRVADRGGSIVRRVNYLIGELGERYCFTKPSTRLIVAVSQKAKLDVERHYRVDSSKCVVIPHGVDCVAFHPSNAAGFRTKVRETLGFGFNDFVVLFVGGDYRLKGLVTLLDALRHLPDTAKVIALGVRSDRYLRELCISRELTRRVKIVPHSSEPARYYAAADCFALPTRYDTFSLATLEAMASGVPVIVSREAGVSDYLTNGNDSFILDDPKNSEQLALYVGRLMKDEGLHGAMGTRARRTAEGLSWDVVAESTLAAYRRLS